MFDAHKRKGSKRRTPWTFSLYFPFTTNFRSLTVLLPLSGKKKIKRLEEVAVWHLVKKIQKIRTKKHTAAGEGKLLLANENVSTLSSKKIHSYTCNLGKMGH